MAWPKWISMTKPPSDGSVVLLSIGEMPDGRYPSHEVGAWWKKRWWRFGGDCGPTKVPKWEVVTHWMPLPPLPPSPNKAKAMKSSFQLALRMKA